MVATVQMKGQGWTGGSLWPCDKGYCNWGWDGRHGREDGKAVRLQQRVPELGMM